MGANVSKMFCNNYLKALKSCSATNSHTLLSDTIQVSNLLGRSSSLPFPVFVSVVFFFRSYSGLGKVLGENFWE